jgi:hypothetical protein
MDYQDFVLQLDRAPGEHGLITRVIRSPAGEAEAPFVNPVSSTELDDLWQVALQARQASRGVGARNFAPLELDEETEPFNAERTLEEIGERLFQALFRGPVHSCWSRSLAESAQDSRRGLRLKLQLNLTDPLLAPLAELPWECLFSLEQGGFLGLQRRTPILRHMRLPLPPGRAPVAQALRVLIVSSQPCSMPQLTLKKEGKRIADALGTLPGVETYPLHNPSVEELRDTLLEKDFHVLHFMGHGEFDAESGQGVLYFTNADGSDRAVSGTLLASHLADLHSLRLVFVNACETACANARAPFAGVAAALLRAGLPAVIAMQRPIGDESALEFSRAVYRRTAAGDPVDAAVTEGRLAIARGQGTPLEWGTPVLFLRAEDGRIFAPAATATAPDTSMPARIEARPEPSSIRTQRLLLLLVLAGVLAVGLRLVVAQWPFGAEPEEASIQTSGPSREGSTDRAQPPPEVSPRTVPEPEQPVARRAEEGKPREGAADTTKVSSAFKMGAEEQEPADQDVSSSQVSSVPAPSRSSSQVLSEDSPASFPGMAEVGAHFFEREGRFLARFWVAPQGGAMLQQPPVLGPGPIEFPAQNGTYRLDVLSLDAVKGRATVRLSLVP